MVFVVSGEGQLKILQGSRGDILINYKRKKYVFGIGMSVGGRFPSTKDTCYVMVRTSF
jgi:hypothetical protein